MGIFATINLIFSLFFPFFLFFSPTSGRKMQVALFFLLVIISSAGVGNACIQPPCPKGPQYWPNTYPTAKRWTENRESNNIHAMKKTRMMMMKKMMAMNTAENDEEY